MKRVLECAEKFDVHVYLTDDVPSKLLPRGVEYLGYVFINDEKDKLLQFAKYADSIDRAANNWSLPTLDKDS